MTRPKNKKYSEFRQGIFKPRNPEKCVNKTQIEYRSHLEFRVMIICDRNPMIAKWGSENVVIPYVHPIKSAKQNSPIIARYFMDFFVETHDGGKFLLEIKPEKQTKPPKKSKNKKLSTILYENTTYSVNCAKWAAAKKYADKHNMRFYILTEKDIDKLEKISNTEL